MKAGVDFNCYDSFIAKEHMMRQQEQVKDKEGQIDKETEQETSSITIDL